jgi:antitoxin component of MazEF toxin-antitoxin module
MQIHMSNDTRVSKGGRRILLRRRKYSLDKLVAQIKPGNRHAQAKWGEPRGKEVW